MAADHVSDFCASAQRRARAPLGSHNITVRPTPRPQFRIFERDESFGARRQGYGLTLQQGAPVLERLGVLAEVQAQDTPSDAHFVFAPNGDLLSAFGHFLSSEDFSDGSVGAPLVEKKRHNLHIPRQRLRECLLKQLESLEPAAICWGRKFDRYEERNGRIFVHFTDVRSRATECVETKILVGADGFYSGVRAQKVGSVAPNYLGMIVVLGMAPSEHSLCNKTKFQTLDGATRLFTMPFSAGPSAQDNWTFWQLSFPCQELDACSFRDNIPVLRTEILGRLLNWHCPVGDLIRETPLEMITATLVYDRGESYPFISDHNDSFVLDKSLVTLLGDAAHPMSPFKGQGANQALLDAVSLADLVMEIELDGAHDDIHTASEGSVQRARHWEGYHKMLRKFEENMYARSNAKVQASRHAAQRLHNGNKDEAVAAEVRGLSALVLDAFRALKLGASTEDLRGQVRHLLTTLGRDATR